MGEDMRQLYFIFSFPGKILSARLHILSLNLSLFFLDVKYLRRRTIIFNIWIPSPQITERFGLVATTQGVLWGQHGLGGNLGMAIY